MDLLQTNNSIFQRLDIRSDVSDKTKNLGKRIQKSAFNENPDKIDKNRKQDQLYPDFLSQKTDAMSGILRPVLAKIVLLNRMLERFFLKLLMTNAIYKTICDHIHDLLPLNNL